MSERGAYDRPRCGTSTAAKAAGISLVIVGFLLAPVIAIVGGAALAAAVGGRGGQR